MQEKDCPITKFKGEFTVKIYEQGNQDIVDALTQTLEKETGTKIFTLRILDDINEEEGFEAIVVFEDKSVLMTLFTVQTINGKIALRMRGNYI